MIPKISIVIPNYNQGEYLEETIQSVLRQNYPNIEILVVDGGSTDTSVNIIKKYNNKITWWVSEKDEGQSDAINKGFLKSTGDYIAWINSDDLYCMNAFNSIFYRSDIHSYDFIYGSVKAGLDLNENKTITIMPKKIKKYKTSELLKFFFSTDYIVPSQSVFVKRTFLDKYNISFLDSSLIYCMDMEWYCRIFMKKPRVLKILKPYSFFRIHPNTKTTSHFKKMQNESISILYSYYKFLSDKERKDILSLLYLHRVLNKIWRNEIKMTWFLVIHMLFYDYKTLITDKRFLGLVKRLLMYK